LIALKVRATRASGATCGGQPDLVAAATISAILRSATRDDAVRFAGILVRTFSARSVGIFSAGQHAEIRR
jgi:hypothetical protein